MRVDNDGRSLEYERVGHNSVHDYRDNNHHQDHCDNSGAYDGVGCGYYRHGMIRSAPQNGCHGGRGPRSYLR
jgi:hypothetical protein